MRWETTELQNSIQRYLVQSAWAQELVSAPFQESETEPTRESRLSLNKADQVLRWSFKERSACLYACAYDVDDLLVRIYGPLFSTPAQQQKI